MPLPLVSTPTTDLTLTWTPTGNANGQTVVDFGLNPEGDMGLVVGIDRLVQDVTRWLYTPPGANPFDPAYGNPLWTVLGQPYNPDLVSYEALIQQGEEVFLATQANAYRQGWLADDEMVDHFDAIQVFLGPDGMTLIVNLVVVARTGVSAPVGATLS